MKQRFFFQKLLRDWKKKLPCPLTIQIEISITSYQSTIIIFIIIHLIYPDQLELKKDTIESNLSASCLDILIIDIDPNDRLTTTLSSWETHGWLRFVSLYVTGWCREEPSLIGVISRRSPTMLHYKLDYFNFGINFPYLCSNIPLSSAYGVYIIRLVHYAKAKRCHAYMKIFKTRLTANKKSWCCRGYNKSCLKSSFRWFYCRYLDLACDYKLSLGHMLNDFFHILCYTIALTTGNPLNLILTKGRAAGVTGQHRMLNYSSMAPDPTFAFVAGPCCLTLNFVYIFFWDYDHG
jgi:hypothetical protein